MLQDSAQDSREGIMGDSRVEGEERASGLESLSSLLRTVFCPCLSSGVSSLPVESNGAARLRESTKARGKLLTHSHCGSTKSGPAPQHGGVGGRE